VRRLERAGAVRRDLEPASTTSDPLEDVRARIPVCAATPGWLAVLDDIAAARDTYATSDLPTRRQSLARAEATFARATSRPPRRGKGEMYADRTLLFEECAGDLLPVRMSTDEAERIERSVSPILDLAAAYGALVHAGVRTLAREIADEIGTPTPWLVFAEAIDRKMAAGALEPHLADARRFSAAWAALVAECDDGRVATLPIERLSRVWETAPRDARFASVDIMYERREIGPPRLVIGEIHPYAFAWGSQAHFAPERAALLAAFREDLSPWGGAARMATVLRRRRHKGLVTAEFPGRFIELTARSVDDPRRRIAASDLEVHRTEAGVALAAPDGPLVLYVGEDDAPHLAAFAPPPVRLPPLAQAPHTSRIMIGDVVMQRARWCIEALPDLTAARDPGARLRAICDARHAANWPRFVFAKAPSETKPMFIDLDSPFSQAHLAQLLAAGSVTLTEMLPDPEGLWLQRRAGVHTSELRLALVRSAA
jgi:hypothetical protein